MLEIILAILLLIGSIVMIAVVLLRPGKSAGMGAMMGGADDTFTGKAKIKGYEAKLDTVTKFTAGIIFVLALVLVILQRITQ